jgi:hypothetical protein
LPGSALMAIKRWTELVSELLRYRKMLALLGISVAKKLLNALLCIIELSMTIGDLNDFADTVPDLVGHRALPAASLHF